MTVPKRRERTVGDHRGVDHTLYAVSQKRVLYSIDKDGNNARVTERQGGILLDKSHTAAWVIKDRKATGISG